MKNTLKMQFMQAVIWIYLYVRHVFNFWIIGRHWMDGWI